jgi:hypothetical protein
MGSDRAFAADHAEKFSGLWAAGVDEVAQVNATEAANGGAAVAGRFDICL